MAAAIALGGAVDTRTGARLIGAVNYLEALGMGAVREHEAALLDQIGHRPPRRYLASA